MPSSRPWLALVGVGALLVVLATGVVALVVDEGPPDGWCGAAAAQDAGVEGDSWGDLVTLDGRSYEAVADGEVGPADVDTSRVLAEVDCRGDGSGSDDRVEATSLEPGTRLFPLRTEPTERRIAAETDRGYVVYAIVVEEVGASEPPEAVAPPPGERPLDAVTEELHALLDRALAGLPVERLGGDHDIAEATDTLELLGHDGMVGVHLVLVENDTPPAGVEVVRRESVVVAGVDVEVAHLADDSDVGSSGPLATWRCEGVRWRLGGWDGADRVHVLSLARGLIENGACDPRI